MARTRRLLIAALLISTAGCSTSESAATSTPTTGDVAPAPSTLPTAAPSSAPPTPTPTTDMAPDSTSVPTTTVTTTDAAIERDIVVGQEAAAAPAGVDADALFVTYRMPGSDGIEVQSNATVLIPTTPAPADGWPIVVYSQGAAGLAPQCAPSRSADLNGQASFVAPMVAAGAVVVIPDGEGMTDGGRPTFRDALSQATTVLSAVRAASEVVDGAGSAWASIGYSLGGQAAIAAAEGASRLPDLDFRGAFAVAPAPDPIMQSRAFDERIEGGDGAAATNAVVLKNLLLGSMVEGLTVRHPTIDSAAVFGDQAEEVVAVLHEACVIDTYIAISTMVGAHIAAGGTPATFGGLQADWYDDPAVATALESNAIGTGTVTAPITIVHGPADEIVPFAATQALVDTLRSGGIDVTLLETAASNHAAFVSDPATASARDEFVAQVFG